jgi:UDP-N-acetylglucosamine 1-carboxyvinyltransferase
MYKISNPLACPPVPPGAGEEILIKTSRFLWIFPAFTVYFRQTEDESVDKFIIRGGRKLEGTIAISGSKNAALALMPATLLASGRYEFKNVPQLRDITTMAKLLQSMGTDVDRMGSSLMLNTFRVNRFEAPYEHVKKMRASVYVLGPLVARYGQAKVSLPGGCAWGPRPVNLHIEGIRKLGASVEIEQGYIIAKAKRLKGAKISFDISSVGATGNILMAAVLARGNTLIGNAAIEPEITALANFLARMGAKIDGIGTTRLEVQGVDALHPIDEAMIPDRIEAGTFLVAGALTGGNLKLTGCDPSQLTAVLSKLEETGCRLKTGTDWISIRAPKTLKAVDVTTAVYPGFPTDMQAQWISLMSVARGSSVITDSIYFDRFKHVPELMRLGADIELNKNIAVVRGVKKLTGAKVMSTDLRASASLVLAGLVAEGTTEVLRVYHLDRGYESFEKRLQKLGARIRRATSQEY